MIDDRVRAVLDRLYADNEQQRNANLPTSQRTRNLTPDSGRFLMLLAAGSNVRRAVEIGSSNGVSTIWLAAAMRATGGLAIGTELIPERAAEANTNLAEAGLQEFRPGAGGCRRRAKATRGTVRPGVHRRRKGRLHRSLRVGLAVDEAAWDRSRRQRHFTRCVGLPENAAARGKTARR